MQRRLTTRRTIQESKMSMFGFFTGGATAERYKRIDVTEAAPVLDRYLLVDIRGTGELFELPGHIPGSVHAPQENLARAMATVDRATPLLVICRSGRRAESGSDALVDAGFTDVTLLNGGMIAWRSAGLTTSTSKGDLAPIPTSRTA
jgi:rhodanese-related sulfurtransferase